MDHLYAMERGAVACSDRAGVKCHSDYWATQFPAVIHTPGVNGLVVQVFTTDSYSVNFIYLRSHVNIPGSTSKVASQFPILKCNQVSRVKGRAHNSAISPGLLTRKRE